MPSGVCGKCRYDPSSNHSLSRRDCLSRFSFLQNHDPPCEAPVDALLVVLKQGESMHQGTNIPVGHHDGTPSWAQYAVHLIECPPIQPGKGTSMDSYGLAVGEIGDHSLHAPITEGKAGGILKHHVGMRDVLAAPLDHPEIGIAPANLRTDHLRFHEDPAGPAEGIQDPLSLPNESEVHHGPGGSGEHDPWVEERTAERIPVVKPPSVDGKDHTPNEAPVLGEEGTIFHLWLSQGDRSMDEGTDGSFQVQLGEVYGCTLDFLYPDRECPWCGDRVLGEKLNDSIAGGFGLSQEFQYSVGESQTPGLVGGFALCEGDLGQVA